MMAGLAIFGGSQLGNSIVFILSEAAGLSAGMLPYMTAPEKILVAASLPYIAIGLMELGEQLFGSERN